MVSRCIVWICQARALCMGFLREVNRTRPGVGGHTWSQTPPSLPRQSYSWLAGCVGSCVCLLARASLLTELFSLLWRSTSSQPLSTSLSTDITMAGIVSVFLVDVAGLLMPWELQGAWCVVCAAATTPHPRQHAWRARTTPVCLNKYRKCVVLYLNVQNIQCLLSWQVQSLLPGFIVARPALFTDCSPSPPLSITCFAPLCVLAIASVASTEGESH
jgi:hypothetical protein